MNQSKPVFPKNAPIKKLTTKIWSQTEFTMSRCLSAHNNGSRTHYEKNSSLLTEIIIFTEWCEKKK